MNYKFAASWMAATVGSLILSLGIAAQQTPQSSQASSAAASTYDSARETVLSGTVTKYTANSTAAPMGARVSLQTSSGAVEVHLGNAKLLSMNHLSLQPGDALRVTGENVTVNGGTIFAARSIQKGSLVVMLRSKNGIPLLGPATIGNSKVAVPGGAR
jgi:hypothetical protein